MHRAIGGGPAVLGRPLEGPTRLFAGPVYAGIRAVTKLVGGGIDVALAQVAGLVGESTARPEHEAIVAVLNGVLGDYLAQTENPLAIEMQLRHDRHALVPPVTSKLLVLVHGSCMTDRQWMRGGHDHGAALARSLGYTPLYLHYNTGLHISTNGRALADLLERLAEEWPVAIDEIAIVGHSMGGLVSRSACHYGAAAAHAWRPLLRKLVCLGTPHHGAPLERGGNWIDIVLGVSRYSAPFGRLGRIRSAGVTDMRFGNVIDEDWEGRDRFAHGEDCRAPLPLPAGIACFAIAATTAPGPDAKPSGDGLVPVDSALGRCDRPELTLAFPESNQWIAYGTGHLDLLDRAEVYAKLESWLA